MPRARQIIQTPTTCFGPRRLGARPDMVVLHYTAMQTAEAALERLCAPEIEVSSHYLIGEQGQIWQMVDEDMRAWHAGAGRWGAPQGAGNIAVDDVNSRSIGIELANRGDHPFSEPQMHALEELLTGIMARWDIIPARIIGHSDMAPGRKIDPGARFDWRRLARGGMAVWPDVNIDFTARGNADANDFFHDAAIFGYPVADVTHADLLVAFRMRFRPEIYRHMAGDVGSVLVAPANTPDTTDRRIMRALAHKHPGP